MGRGYGKTGRTTKWGGVSKKRCEHEGCKKRGRHLLGKRFLCRQHYRIEYWEGEENK